MAYGSNSAEIKDITYLGYGIHKDIIIDSIEAGLKPRKNSEISDDVIDIVFKNTQGQHQFRLFNPDKGDDATKIDANQEYTSKALAYIAHKILNIDVVIPTTIQNWEELKAFFLNLVGDKYKGVKFSLKLLGNVYNGKANISIARYFGWLERMDSGKLPTIGPNEMKGNFEYDAKIKNTAETKQGAKTDSGDGSAPSAVF